jgi:PAS domain-containing protein
MSRWDDWTLDDRAGIADVVELDDTGDGALMPVAMPAAAKAGDIGLTAFRQVFDELPFAIYSVDREGRLAYFNPASVDFAGRLPMLGKDKWCVSWKLYSAEGQFIRHGACPMAVAINEGRAVRGVTAIAERPNGTRVPFMPFPTPIRDGGRLVGAFNMLIAI